MNYSPDTTYTFTTTSGASPEGSTPIGFVLGPGDFAVGEAIVTGLYVYDASATFTMTATETGSGSSTGTSVAITVNPNQT